jgi:cation diffusion facilitator CzcD-associated flavoprotein CzcO
MTRNGKSGVQIIPKMAQLPNTQVIALQRTPNFIYAPLRPTTLLGRDDGAPNPAYSDEDRKKFAEDPEHHCSYRRKPNHQINGAFKQFIKDSPTNKFVCDATRQQMTERLQNDPETLIPQWELGCRRITPAEGYLEPC